LNRVNFSGVIKGDPIGGLAQTGTYKVDCRFNKADIRSKIETIAKLKGKIKLYNKDAGYLIWMSLMKMKAPMFLNIDPTIYHLVFLEAMLFEPYYPLGVEKDKKGNDVSSKQYSQLQIPTCGYSKGISSGFANVTTKSLWK
jgi:hypothetical protein